MDKIQPLLVHKFWILFGLTVILPPIGWWSASGELAEEIEERTNTLETTFNGIPSGQNSPNQEWVKELNDRTQQRRLGNQAAHRELWYRQQDQMVWPLAIRNSMALAPFRDTPSRDGQLNLGEITAVPYNYKEAYPAEVRRVWQIVEPLSDTTLKRRKIKFPIDRVPRVPDKRWEALPPSWIEMWDAQEDVWLIGSLLSAISRVNEAANSPTDAHVKEIQSVWLFGGDRKVPGQAAPQQNRGRTTNVFNTRTKGTDSSADFPLTEEFDNITSGEIRKAQPRGGFAARAQPKPADGDTSSKRYVDKGEMPYRTRGFYLKLIIDHRRVPDLLVELQNCEWPVEIVRVQQGPPGQSQSAGPSMLIAANASSGGGGGGEDDADTDEFSGDGDTDAAGEEDDADTDDGTGGEDAFGGEESSDYSVPDTSQSYARPQSEYSSDPNLATVVVAGLLTMYNPPPPEAEAGTVGGQGQQPPTQQPPSQPPLAVPNPVVPEQDGLPGTQPADTAPLDPAGSTAPPAAPNGPPPAAESGAAAPNAVPPPAADTTSSSATSPQ